jgi:ABC-type Zn uptake system ZnuABC Zn-binding protein ZnuA
MVSPGPRLRLDLIRSIRPSTFRVLAPAIVLVLLAACSNSGATASPVGGGSTSALDVVTTTTVFADIVQNVGGARVTATSIIPPGVGPEDYEAKPADAELLSHAGLIVSNDVGLDDFLNKLLQSGTGGATPKLVLGDGIPTIDIDGQPNPHFWLDPALVKQYYIPKITAKLTEFDSAGAATFAANAQAYSAKLDSLDGDLSALVAQIPPQNRKLVTFHDAFPYLARHFGFELVGVILANVGQEPSASELAALVEEVKAAHVTAVFSEAQFNPKLAQTLAQEAGITNVVTTLYNDALGPAPADTYLGMMRYDMEQIVQALK